jgi:phospholipase C
MYEFGNNINMHYTIVLLYKSNRTICMLYGKFTDKGDIPVNKPNIHNVEENNGLSKMSGLQPLTTECVENPFFS